MFNKWEPIFFLCVSGAFLSTWPCSSALNFTAGEVDWPLGMRCSTQFQILVGASLDTQQFFFFEQMAGGVRVEKKNQNCIQKTFSAQLWREKVASEFDYLWLSVRSLSRFPFLPCGYFLNCFLLSLPALQPRARSQSRGNAGNAASSQGSQSVTFCWIWVAL